MTFPALLTIGIAWWAGVSPGETVSRCPNGVKWSVGTVVNPDSKGLVLAESVPGSCTIRLRGHIWGSLSAKQRCVLVLHELGHAILGLPDGHGIMNPMLERIRPPAVCGKA